jgi:hypothetical protein
MNIKINRGKRHPPGPKGHFLLGSLRDFSRDAPNFMVRLAQEYGPISRLRVGPY